ncbi:MAG: isoleucine--tRNA ligase [Candidatus Marinimicrobia bacterium]|nr:isoleucine--tRNA ligase [Candidatus Neomarinimicrobiota bacterium]MBL7023225.1 isoleucine--tRNA ligase [Candidatus Neomarinimicrobiota bacterium]MBL7110307.1 isoleucine--tRNA ligase [Candidatus Neomarinimicrobiota bacterium]
MKKTVKFNKVDTRTDFVALEHKILNKWKAENTFQKLVKKNTGNKRWSFLDGPITANNPMGVHHAWGRTLKDIFQRYHAMNGYDMRYQNGFDCQGLWVEVEVEKELGFKSKRDIEDYGLENFVNQCKERVRKYSNIQIEQSIRLGYWMDWDNSYYTMSDENNYTIWSFLKKLFDEGKIYSGTDVVPWSGRSGTSYSQMEIIEGRKLVAHRAVFVQFPLKDRENENLLVWTTTPWTLTSNVSAAVNVDLDYLKVQAADGSIYYFAKENLQYQRLEKQFKDKKQWVKDVPKLKTIEQIFKEHGGYTVLDTLKGSDMVGWEYKGPFDELEAQSEPGGYPFVKEVLKEQGVTGISCHKVIDGGKDNMGQDIVVAGEGTGIVHIAPGCGDIDNKIGKKIGLVDIAPLNDEAKYIKGFDWLSGLSAVDPDTTTQIIDNLKEKGLLLHIEKYPHIYPHCWRSGEELVFRIVDEWYINMDWRDKIKNIVDDIQWIPEWGNERELEWLENMGDWMISKKRFWGLALPIWVFDDGSYFVVGSKEELKELAVEGWDEFEGNSPHRPWIDKVKIKHPETGLIGTRIPDVGNPWLDAGIVPYSTMNYHSNREYWEKWFPADFVVECFPGQFRNWFYSLLAMSAEMENTAPFKTLLGHALVKDETGRDMHKSWGNAIWFDDAAEKMGVDVMRWLYASQNPEHNLLFGYHAADEVRKQLLTLWNTYSFFVTYASLDGFDPINDKVQFSDRTQLDRWILAKVNELVKTATDHYEKFQVFKLMDEIFRFLDDLSNWYVRRNRRRFWKSESDIDKKAAYSTLYDVLVTFTKLMAPIVPFVAEDIYQNLVVNADENAPESIHLSDFPKYDKSLSDDDLIREIDAVVTLVSLGRSARNKANIKIRQPISEIVIVAPENMKDIFINNREQILEELNIKSIRVTDDENEIVSYQIKPNFAVLGKKYGADMKKVAGLISQLPKEDTIVKIRNKRNIELATDDLKLQILPEEFVIEEIPVENYSISSGQNLIVGINTKLTEDLLKEGIVRDIVRHIQNLRKDSELEVEDRISVAVNTEDRIHSALEIHQDYFLNEVLGVSLDTNLKDKNYTENIKINGIPVEIGIARVK